MVAKVRVSPYRRKERGQCTQYRATASRERAEELGLLSVDSASPGVIGQTAEWVKGYARPYFRPRTPTQFHQEGIRPKDKVYDVTAHCPVPIFFLFDSADVLTRADCRFSNGNLGAGADIGATAEFLRRLEFEKIYHSGSFDPVERSAIVFSRHAEVVVERELDLAALKHIVTRTVAERETLISLLTGSAIRRWESLISVDDTSLGLFERSWTFIEAVEHSAGMVTINFSPDTQGPGPFDLAIEIVDRGTGRRYEHRNASFYCTPQLELTIPRTVSSYAISLTLDRHTAYRGGHFADLPF